MGDGPKVGVGVRLGSGVAVAVDVGVAEGSGVSLGWSACSVSVQAAAVISADSVFTAGGLGCGSAHPAQSSPAMRAGVRKRRA